MRCAAIVAVLLLATPAARAERSTTVNIGGMVGGLEHRDDGTTKMSPAGGPRLTLSFEHPPPPLPPTKDTNADVSLVPEIVLAAVMDSERGEAMIGVGARGEVRLSQRDGGLFHVNARMAFYAAGRAFVIGEHQDPAGEFALGEYVYLGRGRLRLGGEASLLLRNSDEFMDTDRSQHGILVTAYLGWAM